MVEGPRGKKVLSAVDYLGNSALHIASHFESNIPLVDCISCLIRNACGRNENVDDNNNV